MNLLICTDLHNSKVALEKIKELIRIKNPDLVVCCGDISIFEMNVEKMLRSLDAFGLPILLVHGNHEDDIRMEKLCKKRKNIVFIHGKSALVGDVLFLGYGGDGFSLIDPYFERIAKKFYSAIKKNEAKKVILITHAPPNGIKLDRILGGHCGNKSIRKFIEKAQPSYAFCGHIHENFGKRDKIKKTIVMNPGPFGKIVRI